MYRIWNHGDFNADGNIKIMSVNRSHYKIIWTDNRLRPALYQERPPIVGSTKLDTNSAWLSSRVGELHST